MFTLADLAQPIVMAPMAGGPATTDLAAAVGRAGGLGMVAGPLLSPEVMAEQIGVLRAEGRPFGVNVFCPPGPAPDPAVLTAYADELRADGAEPGAPRHHDDGFEAKLEVLLAEAVPVASFTFGCPSPEQIAALQDRGTAVWVTVTTPAEASAARDAGADGLVVQGVEAGGHRGSWDDTAPGDIGLLSLIQLVRAQTDLPLAAAGGLMTGRGVAGALAAGADAAVLGSALMLTPEAGTKAPHREALRAGAAPTAVTRAFSGRSARGIVNAFMQRHEPHAPRAYPDVQHMTAPLRAEGDPEVLNLWAGQAYALARAEDAEAVVRRIAAEAREALADAARRFGA